MSLSVCVRNVRATSQGGNVTEGNMTCENIDTLKSIGYTIEYLDGKPVIDSTTSSFEPQEIEPIVEEIIEEPIEEIPIETPPEEIAEIQVKEPIYVIQEQDIFDHSVILAETNAELKEKNIVLTNENSELKTSLENVYTEADFNMFKLEAEVSKVYANLETQRSAVSGRTPQDTERNWNAYTRAIESSELGLEEYAKSLGLVYNKRKVVAGEPIYWKNYIENWTYEKWQNLAEGGIA